MSGSLVLLLAACGGGARSFGTDGIVVRVPAGWHVSTHPLNGTSDPVQRFVLSSASIPPNAATESGYVPPSDGVLAQVVEEVPPDYSNRWPKRPAHLRIGQLGRMETLGGTRWGEILFTDHGRHFYVFVWIGKRASRAQAASLRRALDSLQVKGS
jgi:hypothetical protein